MSQRGRPRLRRIDALAGPALIGALGATIRLTRLVPRQRRRDGVTLVVCFGAIGDLLLLSAVAERTLPGRRLVLACTPENRVAVSILPDLYEQVLTIRLSRPWSLFRSLRGLRIGEIIDSTQWANVSAIQVGLLKVAQPAAALTGFATSTRTRGTFYDHLVEHSATAHETVNFATLLGCGDYFNPSSLVDGRPPVTGNKIALHLWPSGTRSHLKEWPQEFWVELARTLHAAGYRLFTTGGPDDRTRNDAFIVAADVPVTNLAGIMSLREVFDFFRTEVSLCISVNTGTMHLAALAGTAVVALHGPTNPDRWGPVGPHALSLSPKTGRHGYLNYGFEYPESDDEAYALHRLPVSTVVSSVLTALRAREEGAEVPTDAQQSAHRDP